LHPPKVAERHPPSYDFDFASMEILLNGEKTVIPDKSTVQQLIEHLGLQGNRVAVEVNREIVRRVRWSEHVLQAGDQVEVVHFVGGGEVL